METSIVQEIVLPTLEERDDFQIINSLNVIKTSSLFYNPIGGGYIFKDNFSRFLLWYIKFKKVYKKSNVPQKAF